MVGFEFSDEMRISHIFIQIYFVGNFVPGVPFDCKNFKYMDKSLCSSEKII
jgi:hypothetical protein